ncbi:MAG TPA: tRNA (N(6)-L-threonylcarbamoyladenosine(37)-C(2))-methylthiotransferase MtaB [Candidatus Acidoferrales bacterium]|nr:tRNA (N(6)-L-threonylcarbamoyladenosine(37)-C(2))-methylthiotransferase MtaB [Candidatus Acidoferrales bacterium]
MPTFSIDNFGCRATEADAVAMRHAMLGDGWSQTSAHDSAEVVILNTCTVTSAADAQSREAIRKIHRANPAARIVVTGCYAQRAPEEIAALEGVSCVVGNSRQCEIPNLARDFFPLAKLGVERESSFATTPILVGDILAEMNVQRGEAESLAGDATRPILKIQDGCNNRCAYCIIPSVRGRSRSLPPDEIVASVRQYVDAGVREVVLSGINLGSYGRDFTPRVPLADVVRRILDETALEHLRFSSIEPQHITGDFVAFVASSQRIAPHFHAPLQSGSDRILRAMHRWYRSEHYAARIELIRKMLPHAAIGADVIAGFPGETDADFEATAAFVRSMPFTYLHVFSFSARPGTEAANFPNQVRAAAIRERARALRAIGQQKVRNFRAAQAGIPIRALTLAHSADTWTEAITPNYLKVRIAGQHVRNRWHEVRLKPDAQEVVSSLPA